MLSVERTGASTTRTRTRVRRGSAQGSRRLSKTMEMRTKSVAFYGE